MYVGDGKGGAKQAFSDMTYGMKIEGTLPHIPRQQSVLLSGLQLHVTHVLARALQRTRASNTSHCRRCLFCIAERGAFMRTPKTNCDIKSVDLACNRLHNATRTARMYRVGKGSGYG